MKKTRIATCVLLLLLSLVVSLSAIAQGLHVGVTWGSAYGQDNEYEKQAMSYTCSYIRDLIQSRPNWVSNNLYGTMTSGYNVYYCSYLVRSNPNYDFLATFHVGHMYPKMVNGGYWTIVGYEWIWDEYTQQYVEIPIWEWVYLGTTRHYAYYGWYGASYPHGIEDLYLYSYTGPKHYFTVIWTCANGDLIDGNKYGFVDYQNNTGVVGMPFAWTQTLSMSLNGYANPGCGSYCFMGFENVSKRLTDNTEFVNKNYGDFIRRFYYHALINRLPIRLALDRAMYDMGTWRRNFGQSELYNGWDEYVPGCPHPWKSKMRVYGNGNMVLPW